MTDPWGRREFGPVAPLDIGCGTLLPLRWSDLCAVYHYDHNFSCAPNLVEDKPFEMHVLVATTRGRWDYFGKRGMADIDGSTAVVGVSGDRYGCRHDKRFGDSNLVASLRRFALDEDDEPLFDHEVVRVDASTAVRLAVAAEHDDDFDSRLFELFDVASAISLRDARRGVHGRLRMQRVKRLIEDHAFEELSLAQIAACAGMSPFGCLHQFKAQLGTTPHAYRSALRLQRARTLLRKTSLPIGEIGVRVGIADPAYFSRWFSKMAGASPRTFRTLG
jgi:AraC-like DNA-binding protein